MSNNHFLVCVGTVVQWLVLFQLYFHLPKLIQRNSQATFKNTVLSAVLYTEVCAAASQQQSSRFDPVEQLPCSEKFARSPLPKNMINRLIGH